MKYFRKKRLHPFLTSTAVATLAIGGMFLAYQNTTNAVQVGYPDGATEERKYESRNSNRCKKLVLACMGDYRPFYDDSGCGCKKDTP